MLTSLSFYILYHTHSLSFLVEMICMAASAILEESTVAEDGWKGWETTTWGIEAVT